MAVVVVVVVAVVDGVQTPLLVYLEFQHQRQRGWITLVNPADHSASVRSQRRLTVLPLKLPLERVMEVHPVHPELRPSLKHKLKGNLARRVWRARLPARGW